MLARTPKEDGDAASPWIQGILRPPSPSAQALVGSRAMVRRSRGGVIRHPQREASPDRNLWVSPSLSREGITRIMLEVLLYGMGEHAGGVPRAGDSVVYDRDGYEPLLEGGYIVLKRKTPGLSSFGDYYVLTDKGADVERRHRLGVRELGRTTRNGQALPVSEGRNALWRKRQIILEPELVQKLFDWHGGQFTPTYALASTGMENLVSLSMIDAAKDELEGVLRKVPGKKEKKDLRGVIGDLDMARTFWSESTAKRAGMDMSEDEYEYDRADYGIEDESTINTRSG